MFIWLSWIGDASAYFMGKKFGKHKCAPNVSPGKTWEGVAAEYTTYIIGSAVMSMFSNKTWLNIPAMTWTQCFGLALVLGTMGVLGDLLESFVKRVGGAKDSGDMFPGHGGVLDRFDSFYLAGPLLTLLTFTDMLTP
mmetsp:Transcript_25255/g.59566  ORF Transcript_25255/g.59566 Transcript_25255/m.59566 type:complete len:137 (-) Transcript_25255:40-450(-)